MKKLLVIFTLFFSIYSHAQKVNLAFMGLTEIYDTLTWTTSGNDIIINFYDTITIPNNEIWFIVESQLIFEPFTYSGYPAYLSFKNEHSCEFSINNMVLFELSDYINIFHGTGSSWARNTGYVTLHSDRKVRIISSPLVIHSDMRMESGPGPNIMSRLVIERYSYESI